MLQLEIRLLGGIEVRWSGRAPLHFSTAQARSLFAFLVLNPLRTFHRDVLCGEFWGDRSDSQARKALRTALWRIRSALDSDDDVEILRVTNSEIGFLESDVTWVDALEFSRRIRTPETDRGTLLDGDSAASLARAAELYRGDLLDGMYDDWCVVERERFRLLYLSALERLMGYHQAKGEWRSALARGQEVLQADPLREEVHRQVMICHQAMGNRPSAIRQFQSCEKVLREELDLEPMEETVRLHERIKAGESLPVEAPPPSRSGRARRPEGEAASVIDRLSAATRRLEQTVDRLRTPADG